MSVDTRTPRTPTGGRSSGFDSGFDDAPALSMVKVPSDPAQVIVNHASFRVQLGTSTRRAQSPRIGRRVSVAEDTARIPGAGAAGRAGAARRRPVVWSGQTAPDDTGAHRLLQAVRAGSVGHAVDEPVGDAGATQVIPRIDVTDGPGSGYPGDDYVYDHDLTAQTLQTPVVGAQRGPGDGEHRLLPPMRGVSSVDDERDQAAHGYDDAGDRGDTGASASRRSKPQADDPARHAYYPGRRMNLGVVLLPLRVFLGFISIYAGMGKLCDPVYFDGGERGSMVKWLNTLHPWEVAEPLRQFALQHPVGSGLVIAFLQVVVGVLTVLGCWQRVAAVVGALLSAALIVTVSWKTVPVYDAPDIIYLAAWSPLIIAGAPVYSVDGRLAASAWRRLGPRAELWELRRFVLRRGALLTAVTVGLTLLIGSLLGGAVRDADRVVVPGPGEPPRNELPGSPLPSASGGGASKGPGRSSSPTQAATTAPATDGTPTAPAPTRDTGRAATGGAPSQTQGTAGQAPPQQSPPREQAPSTTTSGPTSGGTSGSSTTGGSDSGSPSSSSGGQPGLVGGLLG
ncbi:DoxX family membrane protein [Streptomyces sp. bgisy159]|uniref:DoxX family membrane protein n=1 Tax=Streptomyces sp. bgisy159 TaxID=3413795 RepID=UPI003F4A0C0B